jgi:hypothetical protein
MVRSAATPRVSNHEVFRRTYRARTGRQLTPDTRAGQLNFIPMTVRSGGFGGENRQRVESNFVSRFNLIWVVQSRCEKYSA